MRADAAAILINETNMSLKKSHVHGIMNHTTDEGTDSSKRTTGIVNAMQ
jgi:hypothetical protein